MTLVPDCDSLAIWFYVVLVCNHLALMHWLPIDGGMGLAFYLTLVLILGLFDFDHSAQWHDMLLPV